MNNYNSGETEWGKMIRADKLKERYNREKLIDTLLENYQKRWGKGNPGKSIDRLLDCMDSAFLDEYIKATSEIGDELLQEAADIQEEAHNTLKALKDSIEKNEKITKEVAIIRDERVAEALKVYETIIAMDFNDPKENLQNIKNASFFIWALYAKESATASMILKAMDIERK